jgi:riboflavin kinase/FMN adenylyltransferase
VLRPRYGMRQLLIGYDHGFGRGRSGDVDTLRRLGAVKGFEVEVVPPVLDSDGAPISSSAIRRAVETGDLDRAAEALGRRYAVTGRVVAGDRRGRLLGFPTLNVAPPSPRKLLPPHGVYAVVADTPLGTFEGMASLGPRPTFDEHLALLEVHLFDVSADLYGAAVRVQFASWLREIVRFASADALAAQLRRDADDARRALTQTVQSRRVKGFTDGPASP